MVRDIPRLNSLDWRTSRTCDGGACVTVARIGDIYLIGNSSTPDGPVQSYTKYEWRDFLTGVKCGDFDDI
jgi:predicted secreted Zn-dependent protease